MKIAFIGAGNMGTAIIKGLLDQCFVRPDDLYISRKHPDLSGDLMTKGVHVFSDNQLVAEQADVIVLAIKPVYAKEVINEIHHLIHHKLIVSIMAGWSYEMLEEQLPSDAQFVRVMPNTPLMVGQGMTLISSRYKSTLEHFKYVQSMFSCSGEVAVVEDHVFSPAMGISGCGPAYVFGFIEALADGGVKCGVPRATAYKLAAQTVIGAAKMLQELNAHPAQLKDAVCSPGGATIEGMYALEKGGMRAAVIEAVSASVEKSNTMMNK